ncbi:MAG: GIY-YIG nuclease family protein [Prolixibacteraceae bacterium]|nr:GIY-YIG nuclease family protein [Prolixibacteraceae bacterium]
MSYFAYILKSEYDNTYYYGSTKNLEERIKIHNKGKGRYTKGRRPWKIHYFEKFESRPEVLKREMFFKSIDGYIFLKNQKLYNKGTGGSSEGIASRKSLSPPYGEKRSKMSEIIQ